ILLASFMALDQLEIAQDIVLVFFIAVVGAAALAAGIAFGLGGREIAAEIARDYYERSKVRPRHDDTRPAPAAQEPRQAGAPPYPPTPPSDVRE
ncbi:MAG: mechanosensitive ion channel family protein, partial [Longimicrobiales bacterium]